MKLFVKLLWMVLALCVLAFSLEPAVFRGKDYAMDRIVICTIPLTFPWGMLIVYLFSGIVLNILDATGFLVPQTGIWNIFWAVALWLIMITGGYLQWFWLVPKFYRHFKPYKIPNKVDEIKNRPDD